MPFLLLYNIIKALGLCMVRPSSSIASSKSKNYSRFSAPKSDKARQQRQAFKQGERSRTNYVAGAFTDGLAVTGAFYCAANYQILV